MTLTEVLMALLVMGIGLVSVFTLFPISLLRAVEATKLTNATLARRNAEAAIEASVSRGPNGPILHAIIHDPDRDGNTREHEQRTEKFVFDPLGANILVNDGSAGWLPTNPPAGTQTNATIFGDFNQDGTLQLGAGNDSFFPYDRNGDGFPDAIRRYTFGLNTIAAAEKFVTLPDSYVTLYEALAGTTFAFNIGTPNQVVVTDGTLGEYIGSRVRLTAFNADTNTSAVIGGTVQTDGQTVLLDSRIPTSVANSASPVPSKIIIDRKERRYTWMATVRRSGTSASVDVAVFFRRSFSPQDERVYVLYEPVGTHNVFIMPFNTIPATLPQFASPMNNGISGTSGAYKNLPPSFEKGGFLLDLASFRWWKITAIQETTIGGSRVFRFSTDPEDYDNDSPRGPVYAVFPRNIIEVYTLKTGS